MSTEIVVFENLYYNNIEIAVHADIDDEGQTVKIKMPGIVQTTKVNAEDPNDKLSGAEFAVYRDVDGDGIYSEDKDFLFGNLEEIETGVYELKELYVGKYFLHEEKAPDNFVRDNIYYPFEITAAEQEVRFETVPGKNFPNKPIKGSVQTTKVNAADPNDKLSGALFTVFIDADADGKYTFGVDKVAGVLEEVQKGVYQLDGLKAGKYLIHETTAPTGFVQDKNYYSFEITDDGQIVLFETIPGKNFPNSKIPDTPKTGDNSGLGVLLAIGIAVLSCAGIMLLVIYKKKRRRA